MLNMDNCYRFPSIRLTGYLCKTNLPSNSAFRGFGAPQSQLVCESIMAAIADHLNISQEQVKNRAIIKDQSKNSDTLFI